MSSCCTNLLIRKIATKSYEFCYKSSFTIFTRFTPAASIYFQIFKNGSPERVLVPMTLYLQQTTILKARSTFQSIQVEFHAYLLRID